MTSIGASALKRTMPRSELDIGMPVEWIIDPDQRETILGVTYEFSHTRERKTVWYTFNKRRAKRFVVVRDLPEG